jgi:hypothetical protein
VANNGAFAVVQTQTNTNFMVIGTDSNGCQDTANVMVSVFPPPYINAGLDVYAFVGETIQFNATTSSTSYSFQTSEIFNPFLATETQMTSTQLERNGDTGSMQIAYHNQTVSYDGITFFSTSSYNLTGTIRVYGLKNG